MKKRANTDFLTLLALATIMLTACNHEKTARATYKAITEAVYASGYIVPKNEYKVYALSDGYIMAKYHQDGDSVKKGDPLFKVQNDVYAARIERFD